MKNKSNYRRTAPLDDAQFQVWLRETAAEAKTASGERKKLLLDALPLHDVCVYLNETDLDTISFLVYNGIYSLGDLMERLTSVSSKIDNRIINRSASLIKLYDLQGRAFHG